MAREQLEPSGAVDDPGPGSPRLHLGRGLVPVATCLLGFAADTCLLASSTWRLRSSSSAPRWATSSRPISHVRPALPGGIRSAIVIRGSVARLQGAGLIIDSSVRGSTEATLQARSSVSSSERLSSSGWDRNSVSNTARARR